MRVIDLELLSADADTSRMLAQFAALFAGMSYLFTFWVIFAGGRFSPDFLWVMEHFLIATTMLVVGLFSVLCWDSIFPDRRDVLVLAPLPVRASTLFRAKIAALIAALSLSVLSLNMYRGTCLAAFFFRDQWRRLPGHHPFAGGRTGSRCVRGGLFMFCCVLGVQGVASQLIAAPAISAPVGGIAGSCILFVLRRIHP